jgi:hypothetical protein
VVISVTATNSGGQTTTARAKVKLKALSPARTASTIGV